MSWNKHYNRERSKLAYPDENLVRLLSDKKLTPLKELPALDLGCGSGRHLKLLSDMGFAKPVGADLSHNGLLITREISDAFLVQCENSALPFRDSLFGTVTAWGSLHYTVKEMVPVMVAEIKRVLAHGGVLLGTMRSSGDTYLKSGLEIGDDVWATDLSDIKGSTASFFREEEIRDLFRDFSGFRYGLIERTIIGDISKKISHWVYRAEKG